MDDENYKGAEHEELSKSAIQGNMEGSIGHHKENDL